MHALTSKLKAVKSLLWADPAEEGRSIYALLDGARDERIAPLLFMRPNACCLYLEPLTEKLRAAAPYLVQLQCHEAFTDQLLQLAWGNSWGVFAATESNCSLHRVRHHFRKLNIVLRPDNHKMLFRYYDPRVLRSYLPTCNQEEVNHMFGPVCEFFVEGFEGSTLFCFHHSREQSYQREYDLPKQDSRSPC